VPFILFPCANIIEYVSQKVTIDSWCCGSWLFTSGGHWHVESCDGLMDGDPPSSSLMALTLSLLRRFLLSASPLETWELGIH
jgi:hypothetical protein